MSFFLDGMVPKHIVGGRSHSSGSRGGSRRSRSRSRSTISLHIYAQETKKPGPPGNYLLLSVGRICL